MKRFETALFIGLLLLAGFIAGGLVSIRAAEKPEAQHCTMCDCCDKFCPMKDARR